MVPGFEELPDQNRPVRLLTSALRSGNIAHAYLFTGPEGVGKRNAAKTFAMACSCRGAEYSGQEGRTRKNARGRPHVNPCFRCRTCRKMLADSHPDLHWIESRGETIRVDQIRELCRLLYMKPYEAEKRIAVIAGAEKLNPEAGNTLLKILEEPPENTIFILTAPQASDLLETILSRCRHIRFNPVSAESIRRWLEEHYEVSAAEASVIASMAGGSISRAESMTEKDWITRRNWLIETLKELDSQPVNCRLAFAEALARDASRLGSALGIMKSWYRDLAVYNLNPGLLINQDLEDEIAGLSGRFPLQAALDAVGSIEEAEAGIQANANPRLTVDRLILELSAGERGKNGESNRHPV